MREDCGDYGAAQHKQRSSPKQVGGSATGPFAHLEAVDLGLQLAALVGRDRRGNHRARNAAGAAKRRLGRHEHVGHVLGALCVLEGCAYVHVWRQHWHAHCQAANAQPGPAIWGRQAGAAGVAPSQEAGLGGGWGGRTLSSASSGKCSRISMGSVSAAMTTNSLMPRLSVFVAARRGGAGVRAGWCERGAARRAAASGGGRSRRLRAHCRRLRAPRTPAHPRWRPS